MVIISSIPWNFREFSSLARYIDASNLEIAPLRVCPIITLQQILKISRPDPKLVTGLKTPIST
jgi:hypothetical protein